ncbi:hypothetical protein K9M41_02900 [Candidatus Gracilibacteria bacterium]|nr:hypothetical protein [Candidatus Gracilibacteria bacterium]
MDDLKDFRENRKEQLKDKWEEKGDTWKVDKMEEREGMREEDRMEREAFIEKNKEVRTDWREENKADREEFRQDWQKELEMRRQEKMPESDRASEDNVDAAGNYNEEMRFEDDSNYIEREEMVETKEAKTFLQDDTYEKEVETGYYSEIPRISYWPGKVNRHTENGVWKTDPDGVSGSTIDKLTYCKKWYPNTNDVREYKKEMIRDWRDRGNTQRAEIRHLYDQEVLSYECVQKKEVSNLKEETNVSSQGLFPPATSLQQSLINSASLNRLRSRNAKANTKLMKFRTIRNGRR